MIEVYGQSTAFEKRTEDLPMAIGTGSVAVERLIVIKVIARAFPRMTSSRKRPREGRKADLQDCPAHCWATAPAPYLPFNKLGRRSGLRG